MARQGCHMVGVPEGFQNAETGNIWIREVRKDMRNNSGTRPAGAFCVRSYLDLVLEHSAGRDTESRFARGCVEKMAAVCDCGVFVSVVPKAAYIFGLALACMPDATVAAKRCASWHDAEDATSCIAAALGCLRHLSTAPIFHLQARLPSTQVREDAQRPAAGTSSWLGKRHDWTQGGRRYHGRHSQGTFVGEELPACSFAAA